MGKRALWRIAYNNDSNNEKGEARKGKKQTETM